MTDITQHIAEHISTISAQRKKLALNIRQNFPEIVLPIQKQDLNGLKICGVDGGFLKKEFQGLTLLIRRAVGVCFSFENNKVSAEYLPSKNPKPEPIIISTEFTLEDVNIMSNLKRVEIEIKTALDCVKKFSPNLLVLDGSIVLHPSSIPSEKSAVLETYKEVVMLIRELYEYCSKNQILLVGACEDSRGRKFCNMLANKISDRPEAKILNTANDTTFLYYLLKTGERTDIFAYTSNDDAPGLSDLGEWRKNIFGMYIKPSEFDRPIRLDFLASNPKIQADKISALVNEISKQNRTYAYPSVLIEADARAKLSEEDLISFHQSLLEKLGMDPSIFELRREQRPI